MGRRLVANGVFGLALCVLVFPVFYMVVMSFRPVGAILEGWQGLLSAPWTVEHYVTAFTRSELGRWLGNTVLVAVTSTVICLALSLLAGYALARFHFPGAQLVSVLLLLAQIFPAPLLIIPVYLLMQVLGIRNPYVALIVAHVSFGLPFCVWMLANYLRSVPRELEEAARVDGASLPRAIWSVIVPVAAPGMGAAAIFVFLESWGDFIWALVFATRDKYYLLSVGIQQYSADVAALQWGALLAMATVYTLPVTLLFYLLQRLLVRGLVSGAVTG
jgi:ABC-type glycerol-3-phosphate transport system permease component